MSFVIIYDNPLRYISSYSPNFAMKIVHNTTLDEYNNWASNITTMKTSKLIVAIMFYLFGCFYCDKKKLHVGVLLELTDNWYVRYTNFFPDVFRYGFKGVDNRSDILSDYTIELVIRDTKVWILIHCLIFFVIFQRISHKYFINKTIKGITKKRKINIKAPCIDIDCILYLKLYTFFQIKQLLLK